MKRSLKGKNKNRNLFFRSLIISGAVQFLICFFVFGVITVTEHLYKDLYGINIYEQIANQIKERLPFIFNI